MIMAGLEETIEREGWIAYVSKPEATYGIFYSLHTKQQDAACIPLPMDALFIETADNNYIDHPLEIISGISNHVQYREVLSLAKEKKIPIYMGDVCMISPDTKWVEAIFEGGEFSIGGILLNRAKKTQRRSFLRAGALLGGIWLMSPLLSKVPFLFGSSSDIAAKYKNISERLHPEISISHQARNRVIAHKMEWIAKRLQPIKPALFSAPHLGLLTGSQHTTIEQHLLSPPENRLSYLKTMHFILQKMVLPESFYSIIKVETDGNTWFITEKYEVPELKAIMR